MRARSERERRWFVLNQTPQVDDDDVYDYCKSRFLLHAGGGPRIAVSTGFWPSTAYRAYRHVSCIVRIMGLQGVCHRVSGRGLTGRSVCRHADGITCM